MKKLLKSALSLILAVSVIFSLFVFNGVTASAVAVSKEEARAWALSKKNLGLDYDGQYGNQCVDLIFYYYQYLGVSPAGGNANSYAYNALPAGWQRITMTSGFIPQPGDIAVWKTNYSGSCDSGGYSTGSYGHIGIITAADSVGFMSVNQNFNRNGKCIENWFYLDGLQCIIRPNFTSSLTATKTLTCDYRVTIPANYKLWLYTTATTTAATEWINGKEAAYTLRCDRQVTLSNGTVRYRFTSGDNKVLYLSYDSSVMSLTINHHYQIQSATFSTCNSYGKITYNCLYCNNIKNETVPMINHSYDNECDTSCNSCGKTRAVPHTYSNACDDECNTCYAKRSISHKYDNDCDKNCNICDNYRDTQHAFSGKNTTHCNKCGTERVFGDELIKENGIWYYYYDSLKSAETKLVKFKGKWFYVEDGVWNKTTTTLVKYEGQWFYVKNGKWAKGAETLVKYKGEWFYIKNGKWARNTETLVKYEGKIFYINNGKWNKNVNKNFKFNSKTYKIKNGKVVE